MTDKVKCIKKGCISTLTEGETYRVASESRTKIRVVADDGNTYSFFKNRFEKVGVTCSYCDFKCNDDNELGTHLNNSHIKCICGTVFDTDAFDDNLTTCGNCRDSE